MKSYKQNEDGHLVPDEDGAIWRRTNIFQITLPLTDLVRTANSREDPVFKTDPPPRFSRNIHGKARAYPEIVTRFHIYLFHDGQLVPYRGPINVHFGDATSLGLKEEEPGIGWALTPNVENASELDRDLLLSVRLPEDRFDWLWQQLGDLEPANLAVTFRMDAWQTEADKMFGPENNSISFALLGSSNKSVFTHFTPIYSANFSISDEKPPKPEAPTPDLFRGVSEHAVPMERTDVSGSLKEIQTALWWIMGLLGVLIVAVWRSGS